MSTDDENDYGGGREGGDASYDNERTSNYSSGGSGGCLKILTLLFLGGVALFAFSKCANGQDLPSPRQLIEPAREIPYTDRRINYDSQSPAHSQQQRDYRQFH